MKTEDRPPPSVVRLDTCRKSTRGERSELPPTDDHPPVDLLLAVAFRSLVNCRPGIDADAAYPLLKPHLDRMLICAESEGMSAAPFVRLLLAALGHSQLAKNVVRKFVRDPDKGRQQ